MKKILGVYNTPGQHWVGRLTRAALSAALACRSKLRTAMRKHFHRMLVVAVHLAAGLAGGTWIYAQHPKFGKLPDGARLDTI